MAYVESMLRNPIGYNMDQMAERLSHLAPILDLNSWHCMFDIGAMDGWEGVNMARVFPDAIIHAFEPSDANCKRCVKTYELQPMSIRQRIALSKAVITDTTGPVDFWEVDEEEAIKVKDKVNWGMGSIKKLVDPDTWPWEHNIQRKVTAHGFTMDDWCIQANIQKVDAVWMDVQGAELHVFKGAVDTLANVQAIMTEIGVKPYYNDHNLKPEVDAFLETLGFKELETARQQAHEYELNVIYVNQKFVQ
jgi:2-O-methyltransferase